MSELKSALERKYPDYTSSALYFGYMDMTYFAITPPPLKDKKLKIALVYLHTENRFEYWLAAANRMIQADIIKTLSGKDLLDYRLSTAAPGVDSIIETIIVDHPDFDDADFLMGMLDKGLADFSKDMMSLVK